MQVQLEAQQVSFIHHGLPEDTQQELQWCALIVVIRYHIGRCTMCMHIQAVQQLGFQEYVQSLHKPMFPGLHHLCAQSIAPFFVVFSVWLWAQTQQSQQLSHCVVMQGLAKPEGLLDLSGCGGNLQQQLPDAHWSSKAWPQAPRCSAGSHMPQGYEFRAGQLPGQPGPVSR